MTAFYVLYFILIKILCRFLYTLKKSTIEKSIQQLGKNNFNSCFPIAALFEISHREKTSDN